MIARMKKVVESTQKENERLKEAPGVVMNEQTQLLRSENANLKQDLFQLKDQMGQKLAERYDAKERGMAKVVGDHEKLRKDLAKVGLCGGLGSWHQRLVVIGERAAREDEDRPEAAGTRGRQVGEEEFGLAEQIGHRREQESAQHSPTGEQRHAGGEQEAVRGRRGLAGAAGGQGNGAMLQGVLR